MKRLLTLEWNSKLLDGLGISYSLLAESDEDLLFSAPALPATLDATCLLLIDIASQSLRFIERGNLKRTFQISTATNGAGCRENSGCTPLGWHRIAEKIGDNQPLGTVFKGRRAVGLAPLLSSAQNDDLITSRILWLTGLQPGVNAGGNVDSYSRYIYIHGTAQEQLIGAPVSHGCVRMVNDDVIDLFDRVDETTVVLVCHNIAELTTSL